MGSGLQHRLSRHFSDTVVLLHKRPARCDGIAFPSLDDEYTFAVAYVYTGGEVFAKEERQSSNDTKDLLVLVGLLVPAGLSRPFPSKNCLGLSREVSVLPRREPLRRDGLRALVAQCDKSLDRWECRQVASPGDASGCEPRWHSAIEDLKGFHICPTSGCFHWVL